MVPPMSSRMEEVSVAARTTSLCRLDPVPALSHCYEGTQYVVGEANQLRTWRRVVGPCGDQGEGSAPTLRR
jgi:hypothetical protein